jgi:hypothetical protein
MVIKTFFYYPIKKVETVFGLKVRGLSFDTTLAFNWAALSFLPGSNFVYYKSGAKSL